MRPKKSHLRSQNSLLGKLHLASPHQRVFYGSPPALIQFLVFGSCFLLVAAYFVPTVLRGELNTHTVSAFLLLIGTIGLRFKNIQTTMQQKVILGDKELIRIQGERPQRIFYDDIKGLEVSYSPFGPCAKIQAPKGPIVLTHIKNFHHLIESLSKRCKVKVGLVANFIWKFLGLVLGLVVVWYLDVFQWGGDLVALINLNGPFRHVMALCLLVGLSLQTIWHALGHLQRDKESN